MSNFYQKTPHVGIVKACLRFIDDPNRPWWQRLFLVFTPLVIVWIISPLDLIPEAFLGPLGLADDSILIVTLFLIVRFAYSFYSNQMYVRPTKDKNGKDIIDL
jgi:uncharacterized membrane protein YkvA (DUF1232 family)